MTRNRPSERPGITIPWQRLVGLSLLGLTVTALGIALYAWFVFMLSL